MAETTTRHTGDRPAPDRSVQRRTTVRTDTKRASTPARVPADVKRRRPPNWSDGQREAARERALTMIAQGKFGGAAGRGGRPHKYAPAGADLLRVWTPSASGGGRFFRVKKTHSRVRKRSHQLRVSLHQEHMAHLLVASVSLMVEDGQLPQLALLHVDRVDLFSPKSREQKKRLRTSLKERVDHGLSLCRI